MTKKADSGYTLWTNPRVKWTRILDNVQFTEADQRAMQNVKVNESDLESKLRPYSTPVSAETLTYLVK